jgi:hypothetical protein
MLTNAVLSEKLNIPIGKVRRWTKELLPPDPKATRRSGYTRQISDNDAFFISLGGNIVAAHGYSYYETRKILNILKPWLRRIGLVPIIDSSARREGIDAEIRKPIFVTIFRKDGDFYLLVEGTVKIEKTKKTDSLERPYVRWFRETVTYWLNSQNDIDPSDMSEMHKTIPIWELLWIFNSSIYDVDTHIAWLNKWEGLAGRKLVEV